MSCMDCAAAQNTPNWPGYQAGCRGCSIRALAMGPAFFDATRAQQITPSYRAALQVLLGEDWMAGHREVKAEYERLQSLKKGG